MGLGHFSLEQPPYPGIITHQYKRNMYGSCTVETFYCKKGYPAQPNVGVRDIPFV
jgi:hypothetical protein